MSKFNGKGRWRSGSLGGGVFSIQFTPDGKWYTADIDPGTLSRPTVKRYQENMRWGKLHAALVKINIPFEEMTMEEFFTRRKEMQERSSAACSEMLKQWKAKHAD
jgi:hypothetical protein